MTEEMQKSDGLPQEIKVDNKEVVRERKDNNNIIFIGGKPLVNYIRGVITQFTKWNASEVTIKSRGKFISKAVDVAEVSRRSMEDKKIRIKDIKIASESFETEGKKTNVSTMDIILRKE